MDPPLPLSVHFHVVLLLMVWQKAVASHGRAANRPGAGSPAAAGPAAAAGRELLWQHAFGEPAVSPHHAGERGTPCDPLVQTLMSVDLTC